MMFGKDVEGLRLELERMGRHFSEEIDELGGRLDKISAALEEQEKARAEKASDAAEKMEDDSRQLSEAIAKVNEKMHEFEKSIASFNNVKNRIDDMLYVRIKEIADAEIESVRKRLSEFSSIQGEFSALSAEMARMRSEMAKWSAISSQVKEVDFSLQKHAKELQLADSRKLELERENENLKSILSKMKRSRSRIEHSRG